MKACLSNQRLMYSLVRNSHTRFFVYFVLAIQVLVSGCGSNTNEEANIQESKGELTIGLTDAEGEFVSYTVDVVSITLTRANGATVHVLPVTTRVDFAQYTELTEFVTSSMVPLGAYSHATMMLDYTNADIRVENAAGEVVQVSDIHDSSGNPVTSLEMTVHLEGRNKLVISNGVPAHLTLDFDLNATNQAVFDSNGAPSVVVEPYLIADVQLQRPKAYRLRGALNSVDADNSSFEIIINPFHHPHSKFYEFGDLTVQTDDQTIYDINSQSFTGLSGLQTLNTLPQFTAVIVLGKFEYNPARFVAREVYAGESVPGGVLDAVEGSVVARSGNMLTVSGATLIRSGGDVSFTDIVTVNIADTTLVKKQLSTDSHTIDEISPGQTVCISGTITDNDIENMQMDAANGVVRMKITNVRGVSADAASSALSAYFMMAAEHFNDQPAALFDFSGTGIDAEHDADPANYEVDTGILSVTDIGALTPVSVFGFVSPFGAAPADFFATSVVDLTKEPAILTMNWTPDTYHPFSEVTGNSVTLNMTNRGVFHHIGRGGAIVNLASISPPPLIRGVESSGWYELEDKGPHRVFYDFEDFIAEIEARLARGSAMKRIVAQGYFDDVSGTLTADTVSAKLK
ncbi:MAG: DUF4382 domain-containing protein [Gammaproteobacteria bacterium]|nr:DUF4382 domain-containing protein [Gammaproteobacteria bacterium]